MYNISSTIVSIWLGAKYYIRQFQSFIHTMTFSSRYANNWINDILYVQENKIQDRILNIYLREITKYATIIVYIIHIFHIFHYSSVKYAQFFSPK